jgi:cyclopropane fatty-acyl-phospholipid synthase-like methyltransferase
MNENLAPNLKVNWIDPFTEKRYRHFALFLKPGMRVLDIGCHTGRGGAIFRNIFPDIDLTGIELSADAIKLIPQGIYNAIHNISINQFNPAGKKYDLIVAGEVIEHIPEKEYEQMLEHCKSLLTENGKILFTTPNPDFVLVRLGRDAVLKDSTHVNIMSVKKFKQGIQKAGLKIDKIYGSGKSSNYLGHNFPINLYGSYFAVLIK